MKQAKVPSDAEFKRVVVLTSQRKHAERNRMALMLSYYAGMRVGEIAQLTWADVLSSNGAVKDRILLRAETTKTQEARFVFVGDKLRRELERYVGAVDQAVPSGKPFLRSQKGKGFSPNTLCQLFRQLYADAGIDGATSHSGRRSFITKLAHTGVSAKVIMTLAGHKHLSTTQRYIDVNDEMLKSAVNLV